MENYIWLPTEIWNSVFDYLEEEDLASLFKTNSYFHFQVKDYFCITLVSVTNSKSIRGPNFKLERFLAIAPHLPFLSSLVYSPEKILDLTIPNLSRFELMSKISSLKPIFDHLPDYFFPGIFRFIGSLTDSNQIIFEGSLYPCGPCGPFSLIIKNSHRTILEIRGTMRWSLTGKSFLVGITNLETPFDKMLLSYSMKGKLDGTSSSLNSHSLENITLRKGLPIKANRFIVKRRNIYDFDEEKKLELDQTSVFVMEGQNKMIQIKKDNHFRTNRSGRVLYHSLSSLGWLIIHYSLGEVISDDYHRVFRTDEKFQIREIYSFNPGIKDLQQIVIDQSVNQFSKEDLTIYNGCIRKTIYRLDGRILTLYIDENQLIEKLCFWS